MVKVTPSANYLVRVRPQEWDEEPDRAHLFAGIFTVDLNYLVHVTFVPDLSPVAPPWDGRSLPADPSAVTTPDQVRLVEALEATYLVTPHQTLAGTDQQFQWPLDDPDAVPAIVFYATPAEFGRYSADLAALSETSGSLHSTTRLADLREHPAIGFVQRRVVESGRLRPAHAALLGRP